MITGEISNHRLVAKEPSALALPGSKSALPSNGSLPKFLKRDRVVCAGNYEYDAPGQKAFKDHGVTDDLDEGDSYDCLKV